MVRITAGSCDKVASDLGLGSVFAGCPGFLHHVHLASHHLAAIINIPNSSQVKHSILNVMIVD